MIGNIAPKLRLILAAGLAAALIPASPAHAGAAQAHSQTSSRAASAETASLPGTSSAVAVMAHVSVTARAADVAATAEPGEGVIRMYTRACGSAPSLAQWQAAADANGITPPVYLVLLGQRLTFSCSAVPSTPSGPVDTGGQPVESSAPQAISAGWVNPTPGACITSPFGWRQNPTGPGAYVHEGVDLGASWGEPIHAAADGIVTRAGWIWSGYGISVTIAHGDDWSTHYAHQSRVAVSVGQHVNAGDVIGYVGATGDVTGPHLHFEVSSCACILGSQIDPVPFMAARGVRLGC